MSKTLLHRSFAVVKKLLPSWLSSPIRRLTTAFFTPIYFSWKNGHFRSCFNAPIDRKARPIPWYTYPCIEFLKHRSYQNKRVLEFGAGNSTLWWASKAAQVVSFEGDPKWFKNIEKKLASFSNIELYLVPESSPAVCLEAINKVLSDKSDVLFDIVIIDGLWRDALVEIAAQKVSQTGIIICDNSEGYGFYEAFKNCNFLRADFFGHAPCVILPHCTSIYFRPESFIFDPTYPIPLVWLDHE